jgi:hypothetical protein
MSEEFEDLESEDPTGLVGPVPDSLNARLVQRADKLEEQRTARFAVPGYDGLLEVEMRSLGYRRLRTAQGRAKTERDEATRELYAICDTLLAATVGFHLVEGEDSPLPNETWQTIATRAGKGDTLTPRQALLALLKESLVMFLWTEWGEWQKNVGVQIAEEVVEDFAQTG